jgi:protein phosphatase
MINCPYCRSTNPQSCNFCQSCGRSLTHYICRSCSGKVEFDSESCSQCLAVSGTYWWAIIESTSVNQIHETNLDPVKLVNQGNLGSENLVIGDLTINLPTDVVNLAIVDPVTVALVDQAEISTEISSSHIQLQLDDASPWDLSGPIAATPAIAVIPTSNNLTVELAADTISEDLTISPWDLARPTPALVGPNGSISPIIKSVSQQNPRDDLDLANQSVVSAIATTHLDAECRYRLLDPVVIQLFAPTDSSQVRVIDRQPFCNSLLEILMEQQPAMLEESTISSDLLNPPITTGGSPAISRQWQFWNSHGIPKVAQAYIALQVSLPGTIPSIRDSWSDEGKTVTIVEDRSSWDQLTAGWSDPQIHTSQRIYWLDHTLKLWLALEPWQMRQSLLESANLLLDEDARICFQRLYPELADRQLRLTDLAKMWQKLLDNSPSVDADRLQSTSFSELLAEINSGELDRVEEIRLRLQQIAYELEPKQLTAPLQSADLSNSQDAPTIALAQKLLSLEEAAATHTGRKRDHNEDCFGIVSKVERQNQPKGKSISARGLYILCDGMGGHDGGEIASAMTVDLLRDYFANCWAETMPDEQTIRDGIVAANEAVFAINQQKSAQGSGRMGTTLVLVLVQDSNIAVAHVGDSRCYGVTPTQGLIQLTLDHEVGQQQILRGVDPEIAYGRPDSYQLTQAIGPRDRNYIAPDIRFFELQEDTLIVLASDGLTDNQLLENYWLTNVAPLLADNADLQEGVDRLIDFANEYNGHDNITALVVRAKMG